jgi:HD superfamily phosphodiesterase
VPSDDDVAFAAAWMHDIGVSVGHRLDNLEALARWDNVAYATSVTPKLLARFDFPEAKVSSVIDVIRTHQPAQAPQCLEGLILRDADILEQLGSIGILPAVYFRLRRPVAECDAEQGVGVRHRAVGVRFRCLAWESSSANR